jgi:hypothetical protein
MILKVVLPKSMINSDFKYYEKTIRREYIYSIRIVFLSGGQTK